MMPLHDEFMLSINIFLLRFEPCDPIAELDLKSLTPDLGFIG